MSELSKAIESLGGGKPQYVAYNVGHTKVFYGTAPPVPIVGWDYFAASHTSAQSKHVASFGTAGVFVSNLNSAGIIEIGIMSTSISCGAIELIDATGAAFPINAVETTAVMSFVAGTACRKIEVPEWRRELMPGLSVYRFEASRLIISTGVRLPQL